MNTKDFLRLGVPLGEATRRATDFVAKYVLRGGDTAMLEDELKGIVANPNAFFEDAVRQDLARAIASSPHSCGSFQLPGRCMIVPNRFGLTPGTPGLTLNRLPVRGNSFSELVDTRKRAVVM